MADFVPETVIFSVFDGVAETGRTHTLTTGRFRKRNTKDRFAAMSLKVRWTQPDPQATVTRSCIKGPLTG